MWHWPATHVRAQRLRQLVQTVGRTPEVGPARNATVLVAVSAIQTSRPRLAKAHQESMSLAVAFLVVVVVAASVPPNKRKHQPALAFLVVVLGAVFAGLTQWRHVWMWSVPKMTKTSVLLVAALGAASARLAASRMHLPPQRRAHAFLAAVLDVASATESEPSPFLPRSLQLAQPTDVKVVVYFSWLSITTLAHTSL